MVDTRFHPTTAPVQLGMLLGDKAAGLDLDPQILSFEIGGAEELETAGPDHVVLAANRHYREALRATGAGVAIVGRALRDDVPDTAFCIVVPDPHGLFTDILEALYPDNTKTVALANAGISETPWLEHGVRLGPGVHVAGGTEIGRGTVIGANSVVGAGVTIGRDCVIGAGVSIECAHIGDNVVIHAGARIGCEGFGWLEHGTHNRKIPQLGRTIIQDYAEIGANSTIDRGALGDTVIGEGSKIDNLVQIGHNCKIGRKCLIAATTGLSGGTILGDGVLMGGGVGTSGHLSIGDGSVVHGRAAVTKDWPAGSKLAGAPAQDIKDFWRELAQLRRLGKGDEG